MLSTHWTQGRACFHTAGDLGAGARVVLNSFLAEILKCQKKPLALMHFL